jgi:DHA1 family tetracycline resistance protein-like MFS transporter
VNRKSLFTIFTIILTDLIGFGIIIPLLPTLSDQLGIKGFWLGLLVASYAIAQFISAPILGNLSDRYGRKPILIISKAGTVVAYIMFAFAGNFPILLLSRLIDGFTGGNITAARAYISDITTKENRSRGMAVIGISFGLGFILGPALGGIFYAIGGSQTLPALVGAGLCLFSLILTQIFLDESHRDNKVIDHRPFSIKKFLEIFKHPIIQQILIVQFIVMTAMSGFQTTLSFFTDSLFGFSPQDNSYLFVYLGVVSLVVQGYLSSHKSKDIHGYAKTGVIISAIGVGLIAISPNAWFMFAAVAINSVGGSLFTVFLPTLLSTVDSKDPEGEIMGAYEGISSLGRVIGPAIFGSLVSIYPRPIYFLSAILVVLALYFFPKKVTNHV